MEVAFVVAGVVGDLGGLNFASAWLISRSQSLIICSDWYAVYLGYPCRGLQLCWAHLKRNFPEKRSGIAKIKSRVHNKN
jgi:hypothetical protein